MSRLIDADALSDLLDAEYRRKMAVARKGETHLDTLAEGIMSVSILLGTMSTVDAVEVVRCKDCKHYTKNLRLSRMCCYVHPLSPHFMLEDEFCSRGERKDND